MRSVACVAVVLGMVFVIPALGLRASSSMARAEVWRDGVQEVEPSVLSRGPSKRLEVAQLCVGLAPAGGGEEAYEEEEMVEIADPLYYWNKGMYHFNDKFYFWLLKPVARAYRWAVPELARTGVRNFFYNLRFPIRFLNCILQAKGTTAGNEFCRFFMNTTVGVLGFGNPAEKCPDLNPPPEDFGQTLGAWCIGNGFYIVWPFLGSSTARDSAGLLGDYFLDPVTYVKPFEASLGIMAYDVVSETSFRIGDYESFKEAAIDPYVAIRDAYVQNRKKKVEDCR